jgi:hypothetical protein
MRKYINLLVVLTIFASCNKGIPKEKLTVIENITLGESSNSYIKQFDSLQIPHKRFFNKILMMKYNDLLDGNNYYTSYYTNLFNFSEFRNPKESLEHLGLITPITLEGTQNNLSLVVILCHTVEPWLLGDAERLKSSVNEKYVRQEVNNEVIDKIKNMYITKYGVPKYIDTSNFNSFWMIVGNTLSRKINNNIPAVTIKWETEYYNITFFTGINLNGIYNPEHGYVESTNGFAANIGNESADQLKNELHCSAYAYIYYELNEKAMKELKTDNKKI